MITGAYKVLYLASTGNPLITYFLIGRGIYVGNDTSQISLCLMFIVINNSSLLTSSDSRLIMSFANHTNNDYFYIDNKYFWLDKTMQLFYLNFILYILQVLTQSLSQLWTVQHVVLNDCVVTKMIDNLLDLNIDMGCHKISNKTGFFSIKILNKGLNME